MLTHQISARQAISNKPIPRIVQRGLTFDGSLTDSQINYATTYFENVFPRKRKNTLTSYDSDLIIYRQFCLDNGFAMVSNNLDVQRITLMRYIDFLGERNRKTTLSRRLNTLVVLFDVCDIPNLFKTDRILHDYKKEVFNSMSGYQSQANAFEGELLDLVNDKFIVETMKDVRDLALVNAMFDGLLRNNEARQMHLEHIEEENLSLFLPDTKADKNNEGTERFISETSINMIKEWCNEANITEGPIWRTISPKGTSLTKRTDRLFLSEQAVTDVIKRILIEVTGKSDGFSSHSLRVGSAITLFKHNISIADIAQAGGWASDAMVLKYVRHLIPSSNGAAKYARIKNR